MNFRKVSRTIFAAALGAAREVSPLVASATSPAEELAERATFYLSHDLESGYAVEHDGTLVGVFSLHKGRGAAIVTDAIANGASALDCFDGYLPGFYRKFGFVETERVANWTPGEPDVVFMALV